MKSLDPPGMDYVTAGEQRPRLLIWKSCSMFHNNLCVKVGINCRQLSASVNVTFYGVSVRRGRPCSMLGYENDWFPW